jgi:hypothetical protein
MTLSHRQLTIAIHSRWQKPVFSFQDLRAFCVCDLPRRSLRSDTANRNRTRSPLPTTKLARHRVNRCQLRPSADTKLMANSRPLTPWRIASSQAFNLDRLERWSCHKLRPNFQGPACRATLPRSGRAAKRLRPPSRACVDRPCFCVIRLPLLDCSLLASLALLRPVSNVQSKIDANP